MINRILTVGGFTLLSRVTGFARDIVMAAVLGAGPIAHALSRPICPQRRAGVCDTAAPSSQTERTQGRHH